jgi:S-adenosylmethionine synthetase
MKKITILSLILLFNLNLNASEYLFSSESVTEGHPDKICDQISDAILDDYLKQDPESRVACETLIAKNILTIAGEITSLGSVNIEEIAKKTLNNIGYDKAEYGFDTQNCQIITSISEQSYDISRGVNEEIDKEQGAGDQGLMFGYATNETKELMPLPISLAHKLTKKLSKLRKKGTLPWLRPDGKAQVTVKYIDEKPAEITTIIISTQHATETSTQEIEKEIKEKVIYPVCKDYITSKTKFLINPTGRFVIGGPEGDVGLTGRKIIVDTYGGMGRHGGGCFSGKDPSKVDRSAAYMARHIAKNIVAAGLADKCEVQIAYSIGIAEPVSIYINTFGTYKNNCCEYKLTKAIREIFPLKPAEIIKYLNLKNPIYEQTAKYGHFGKNTKNLSWEQTNKVDELRNYINKL